MKGDFTRLGFDAPHPATTRVLMQQGRVQLDSDWNEQQAVNDTLRRAVATEAIGSEGTPNGSGGFAIGVAASGNDLTISPGRLLVDGVLCENLVQGATLLAQPFLPRASGAAPPGAVPPSGDGRYLVYLDAWERHVGTLLDPSIREVALGGPDTAARARLVWQVRFAAVATGAVAEDVLLDGNWMPSDAVSTGTMGAGIDPGAAVTGPCILPPTAGYRSLSNQLYRVEIHEGGAMPGGSPTFKWSRDNGIVATTVLLPVAAGLTLRVADLGADSTLGFKRGDWVELIDERMELSDGHGVLLLIGAVAVDTGVITLDASTPVSADTSGTVLLRRWDQTGPSATATGVLVAAGPVALEAGITVSFGGGTYRAGDYWTIPARTSIGSDTGAVIWPAGAVLPAEGIRHHFAALALVDYSAANTLFTLVEDCRRLFDPLAGRLPPLRVRVGGVGVLPGQDVPLDRLTSAGIEVSTRVSLDPSSVSSASMQLLTEAPVFMGQFNGKPGDQRIAGSQLVSLSAVVTRVAANRFAIAPTAVATELLSDVLSLGGGGAAPDVVQGFHIFDVGAPSVWVAQPGGTLGMTKLPPGNPLFQSIAVSNMTLDAPISHLGMTASLTPLSGGTAGSNGTVGLVFNWVSDADFWVFYYVMVNNFEFGQPTLALAHVVDSKPVAQFQHGLSRIDAGVASVALDLFMSGGILAYSAQIQFMSNGQPEPPTLESGNLFPPPAPPPSIPGGVHPVFVAGLSPSLSPNLSPTLSQTSVQSVVSRAGVTLAAAAVPKAVVVARPSAVSAQAITRPGLFATVAGAATPVLTGAATVAAPTTPVAVAAPPGGIIPGSRAGVAIGNSNTAVFQTLRWTTVDDQTTTALPHGRALVRLLARRSLIRTQGEALAASSGGLPATIAPEPDFQTFFWVTPGYSSYYGSGYHGSALGGIGAERL